MEGLLYLQEELGCWLGLQLFQELLVETVFPALWAVSSQAVRLGWEECVHPKCWPDPRGVCSKAAVLPAWVRLEGGTHPPECLGVGSSAKAGESWLGSSGKRTRLKETPPFSSRASEGKTVEVPYKGDVKNTILDILGGLRSTCTYVGAAKLKELSRRATFIRVTQQHNTVFS